MFSQEPWTLLRHSACFTYPLPSDRAFYSQMCICGLPAKNKPWKARAQLSLLTLLVVSKESLHLVHDARARSTQAKLSDEISLDAVLLDAALLEIELFRPAVQKSNVHSVEVVFYRDNADIFIKRELENRREKGEEDADVGMKRRQGDCWTIAWNILRVRKDIRTLLAPEELDCSQSNLFVVFLLGLHNPPLLSFKVTARHSHDTDQLQLPLYKPKGRKRSRDECRIPAQNNIPTIENLRGTFGHLPWRTSVFQKKGGVCGQKLAKHLEVSPESETCLNYKIEGHFSIGVFATSSATRAIFRGSTNWELFGTTNSSVRLDREFPLAAGVLGKAGNRKHKHTNIGLPDLHKTTPHRRYKPSYVFIINSSARYYYLSRDKRRKEGDCDKRRFGERKNGRRQENRDTRRDDDQIGGEGWKKGGRGGKESGDSWTKEADK
ncbi:hypothetical protein Q8A73_006093 [Channa argus]|nr:hypothetical protein Q8A73_006093 [Channa argus]